MSDDSQEQVEILEEEIPEDAYTLPLLYNTDKKGKERVWKIWSVDDTVFKSYGEVEGIKIPSKRTYKGVNMGRSNETTAEEQAIREAERDWVKQLDKGYAAKDPEGMLLVEKVLAAKKKQGGVNVNIAALIRGVEEPEKKVPVKDNGMVPDFQPEVLPMHCQTWSTEPKVLKYFDFDAGVYIQPKLDGIRCLVQIVGDSVVLCSRKGNQFVWLKHLRKEAFEFLKGTNVILDCEVYAEVIYGKVTTGKKEYSYNDGDPELFIEQRFEVISGAARPVRKVPHPLEDQLCLYAFDVIDITLDQDERFELLKKLFARPQKRWPHIKLVETKVINYPEEVEEYHDQVADRGYEGVVVRSRNLRYESNKRSLMMRKHKHFVEEEYPIVGISNDEGVEIEQFVWVCEKIIEYADGTTELKSFNVKPMGTREQKIEWFENQDEYLGKLLTVKYQKIDEEMIGVPRFPRGKAIRDYE